MSARWFIGCMSGTSLDGVDVALLETDGQSVSGFGAALGIAYSDEDRAGIEQGVARALALGEKRDDDPQIAAACAAVTRQHIKAVSALLATSPIGKDQIAAIGFHGQTVLHRPNEGLTWQIGDAGAIADAVGVPVVYDMRSADVAAGGEGAPLAPLYHAALAAGLPASAADQMPLAVLNLGGVGNVTLIDHPAVLADGAWQGLTAFDTGPANGLIDLWMQQHGYPSMDEGGGMAAVGHVDEARLAAMMANRWFDVPPPKSLDRHDFTIDAAEGLRVADGAATLTAFTAATIAKALSHLKTPPRLIAVTGGGRHNQTMMEMIEARCKIQTVPVEQLGWRGDMLEAEAFAFLAARSLAGLALSVPRTTGVPQPQTGGQVVHPST